MEMVIQIRAPAALSPGLEPQYPLDRRLGGPESRSGGYGEEKHLFPLPSSSYPTRCADWAIPAHERRVTVFNYKL
jgi:hypothetical protein